MAKINVLQSSVYNKIAAGEVVERPASIVKELVENSIDAGAKKLEIYVENGGLTIIQVIDDGCGIECDSVETAFLNHATSKISNETDLEKISTLGFRGEALSSIAAVTKVEIITKTKFDEFGTKLILKGGSKTFKDIIGAPVGTSIKISDLFFNTPARKKFLKKPSGETAEITNLVQRLILANPDISIKYVSNGNIVYNSQGAGLESAIFAVYDKNTLSSCKKINWFYKDIEVCGYVGDKNFTKPNRTYQTVIVNGRYVNNNTVCTAVQRAFDRYLTTRAYPFFVLNIKLPPEKVDVNVHPNKLEVKFEDSQNVFYAVYIPVKEILDHDNKSMPEIELPNSQNNIKQSQATINNEESLSLKNNAETKLAFDSEKEFFTSFLQPQQSFISPKLSAPEFALQNDVKEDISVKQETTKIFFEESITVGTAFDTYIIIQNQDNLYFIDQHAAHEMMLYDKFMLNFDKNKNIKQALLIPYIFNAKPDEREFILNNITEIQACGFMIEEFGSSSFKISEVPLMFANADLEQFTNSFLENLSTEKIDIKFIKEKIAKAACKAAVKAGNKLLPDDIEYLKKNLDKSEVFRCPHGRPVIVKITKREIEKWFKRVF